MAYLLKVYKGDVTAGGTDGTAVSTGGANTSPIRVELNASQNESKIVPLAIRADSGYKTTGTTTISVVGDTNNRWSLCWTANGSFSSAIATDNTITATNTLFYAKASSASSELPQIDRSVSLEVSSKTTVA